MNTSPGVTISHELMPELPSQRMQYTVPSSLHQELSQRMLAGAPGPAACVGGGVTAGVEVRVMVDGAVSEGVASSPMLKGLSPGGSFSLPVAMASIDDKAVPS